MELKSVNYWHENERIGSLNFDIIKQRQKNWLNDNFDKRSRFLIALYFAKSAIHIFQRHYNDLFPRKILDMRLNEMMNMVATKAIKDGDAWLCTSPEIASIFETVSYAFKPCEYFVPFRKLTINQSPQYNGVLSGRFRIYTHPLFPTEMILLGIGRGELPPENLGTLRLFNFVI